MPKIKPKRGLQLNRSHQLARGLVACWLMNEGSGKTLFDLSGNGNTGSLVADTHFVAGKFGHALDFDGTGDYVNCGSGSKILITDPYLTYSIWAKWTPMSRWTGLLGTSVGNVGASLNFESDDTDARWKVYKAVGSSSISKPVPTNEWVHLVGVVDGTTILLYVNGLEVGTSAFAGDMPAPTAIWIGDNWDQPLNGQVDHAAIYNRALSASEIALLHRDPFCIFEEISPAHTFVVEAAPAIQELAGVSVIASTVVGELDSPVKELAGVSLISSSTAGALKMTRRLAGVSVISSTAYAELTGGQVPAMRVRAHVGFRPIKDAERLRGLRRNAMY